MKNTNKRFLYISGPTCSGKSTICRALVKKEKSLQYILGDTYWIPNNRYDFKTRVQKTNKDILSSIKNVTSKSILLEWVPCDGPFVDGLKDICKANHYEFRHIIVYAPMEVLKHRKLNRDGNMELGPLELERLKNLENVSRFDTSKESVDSIVLRCLNI